MPPREIIGPGGTKFEVYEPTDDYAPDVPPAEPRDYEWAAGQAEEQTTPAEQQCLKKRPEPLPLVNPVDIADVVPPLRSWLVHDWIPEGHVTELYGAPTVGKSLLMLQLGIACSTGRPWLGLPVKRGRSLMFFCEDDGPELHRRALSICRSMNISMRDLGDCRWQGRAGEQNVIASIGAKELIEPTELFHRMEATIADFRPQLVGLDNIGQLFAGNENSRTAVTQFASLLIGWCVKYETTALLAGHPAKAEGSEYSGSTAWDAVCRSRLFLDRPEGSEDLPDVRDLRTLRCPAANYGPSGGEISLRWQDGAFVPIDETPSNMVDRIESKARERACEEEFLVHLDRLTTQGRGVSHSPTSTNFAPKQMAALTTARFKVAEYRKAMDTLLERGEIIANVIVGRGKDRHPVRGLGRAAKPESEAL